MQERDQILADNPLTRTFIQGSGEFGIWLRELHPFWTPIDSKLKELLGGEEWQVLVTLPIVKKGVTPIEIDDLKINLLEPQRDTILQMPIINYLLFLGYELKEEDNISAVCVDVANALEGRRAIAQHDLPGTRAMVRYFVMEVMNVGAGLREMSENPNSYPSKEQAVKDLLEERLGISE